MNFQVNLVVKLLMHPSCYRRKTLRRCSHEKSRLENLLKRANRNLVNNCLSGNSFSIKIFFSPTSFLHCLHQISFFLSFIDLSYLLVFIINVLRDKAERHLFDNRDVLIDCIKWLTICCWFFGFFVRSGTLKLVTASIISANSNPSRASTDKSTTFRFDLCRSR